MLTTLIISLITITLIILSVIIKPQINLSIKKHSFSISLFWVISLLGAILLIITKSISANNLNQLVDFSSTINPFKILILFICISILSLVLDEAGFFEMCANTIVKKVKHSQIKLFCLLYLVIAVLTVFTSNDIIILTFTPFICYFTKKKNINPIPYLIGEFVAANTLSLLLVIGNPTNIYLAIFYQIDFFTYFIKMAIPTLLLSITAFIIILLCFYKTLKIPFDNDTIKEEDFSINKQLTIVGLIHLIACTICLVVSSYVGFEMWYICLGFAISLSLYLLIYDIIKKKHYLIKTIKRAPWTLIPFVLSMFIIVISLKENGITANIAKFFNSLAHNEKELTIIYGISSFFTCSLINNIPMSVLFSEVLINIKGLNIDGPLFATIIGSNIGAILTPIGALAGIMWINNLHKQEIKFSFIDFIKYGLIISIPTILVGILSLIIEFNI